MTNPRLQDIADAIQLGTVEATAYLDRRAGTVIVLTEEDLAHARDAQAAHEAPEWHRPVIELAREVDTDASGRFLPLPRQFQANERGMMLDFAHDRADPVARESLLTALTGSTGAYGRFKDAVQRLGMVEHWYAHQRACYLSLARHWCEQNSVQWLGDDESSPDGANGTGIPLAE